MTARDLPDEGNVVRYARPTQVLDGRVDGSVFLLRENEPRLSVNWLEYFDDQPRPQQLVEIRRLIRLTLRRTGLFAELNVGETRKHVGDLADELRFVHSPLDPEDGFEADPSHSEVVGLPPGDTPEAELIGDMIAERVTEVHPALGRGS